MNTQQFASLLKSKNPKWSAIDDETLVTSVLNRYPSYRERIDGLSEVEQPRQEEIEKPGFLSRSGTALKERFGEVKKTFGETARGEISPVETGVRVVGDVAGSVGDVVGAAISPQIEKLAQKEWAKPAFEALAGGMEKYEDWKNSSELNRRSAEVIESVINIADLVGASKAISATTKVASSVGRKVVQSTATKFDNLVDTVGSRVGEVKKIGAGIKEQAIGIKNKTGGAIKRIEINAAEKQALRQSFEELDDVSKSAVQQGLLPRDVNLINSATPEERTIFNQLKETASKYSADRTSVPPSQILGDEWLKRLKALDKEVGTKGQELGKFAEQIPQTRLPQVADNVMSELKKVSGLNGLTVDSKGVLNFSNTTLSSSGSASARKYIQSLYKEISKRSGTQLHKLRQELFEELGGRKSSGLKLTATEDRAVEAFRKGISNTLDEASEGYNALNKEYAILANLKKDIKKVFGTVSEGNEDIFNLKSSIVLRRLTSNAKSGQDIAELIRETEKALSGYGVEFGTDIVKVQEFMNLLNRYYDISGDTSLLGILRTSDIPLSRRGVVDKIINSVFENSAVTDETARNAIKELLNAKL